MQSSLRIQSILSLCVQYFYAYNYTMFVKLNLGLDFVKYVQGALCLQIEFFRFYSVVQCIYMSENSAHMHDVRTEK